MPRELDSANGGAVLCEFGGRSLGLSSELDSTNLSLLLDRVNPML